MSSRSLPLGNMQGGSVAMGAPPGAGFWPQKEPVQLTIRRHGQDNFYHHHQQQQQHVQQQHLSTPYQQQAQQIQSQHLSPAPSSGHGRSGHGWDVRKVLHLYMHDYCLKQNYSKAASAIAMDTGVDTEENVPFGRDSHEGLLMQMFTAFWDTYTNLHQLPSPGASVSSLQQDQPQMPPSPHHSSIPSTNMRRTETEPVKKAGPASGFGPQSFHQAMHVNQGGSTTPGPYSTHAKAAEQFWGDGDKSQNRSNQSLPRSPAVAMANSPDAAAAMQRMGWGDRCYDNLNVDEKNKLVNVLKRSQMAQQEALQRMARTHQGNSIDTSANRGLNGTAFQQMPSCLLPPQQQTPGSNEVFNTQQQVKSKKGHIIPAGQGKKRRSSINVQALNQFQQQQQQQPQQQQPATPTFAVGQVFPSNRVGTSPGAPNSILGPSPNLNTSTVMSPMSPAEAARNLEEHQMLARRLQVQTKGILGQQQSASMSRNNGSSPPRSMGIAGNDNNNTNDQAHSAQSEVASQATSQLNAQIVQMQNQLNRQIGPNGGSKLNSNQISQLKMLQGKLNQSVRGGDNDWNKQQEQQPPRSIQNNSNMGDMGPPPSPSSSIFFGQQQQQPLDLKAGSFPNHTLSTPSTPAMTASNSSDTNQTSPDWSSTSGKILQESPRTQLSNALGIIPQFEQYSMQNPQQGDSPTVPFDSNVDRLQSLYSSSQTGVSNTLFNDIDFSNFDWTNMGAQST